MVKKICFLCGKPAVKEGYCEEHWKEKNRLAELPERIEIIQCPKCNLMKFKNKWVQPDIERAIKEGAKVLGEVNTWKFTPLNGKMEVEVAGWIKEARKREKHVVDVKIIKNICPICGRLLGGYYEAKIQLRGNFTGAVMEWIENRSVELRKKDKKAFYRYKVLKEGMDFYFGSKSAAKKIAKGVQEEFDVTEIKTSFEVGGRKDGKELRRNIILLRFEGEFEPIPNV